MKAFIDYVEGHTVALATSWSGAPVTLSTKLFRLFGSLRPCQPRLSGVCGYCADVPLSRRTVTLLLVGSRWGKIYLCPPSRRTFVNSFLWWVKGVSEG
eukprot:4441761-Amphidinium_carterae.1